MKKLIALLLAAVLLCAVLAGCAEEIGRKPIDSRFTASYTEVVTDYKNKYNPWTGKFQFVPDIQTVAHPDEYELLWEIRYDDGDIRTIWKPCTKSEYADFNSK